MEQYYHVLNGRLYLTFSIANNSINIAKCAGKINTEQKMIQCTVLLKYFQDFHKRSFTLVNSNTYHHTHMEMENQCCAFTD